MIIGNEVAVEMIDRYVQALQSGKTVFPFLLVSGRSHIGKTTVIEHAVTELLDEYKKHDYRALYDLHEQLGKSHTIKIETPSKEEVITVGDKEYPQRGIRELNQWLSLAPMGKWKVLYLENIERMSSTAANALLKSFEEPLPGRVIIASTTDSSLILPTIRSRALVVPFHMVDPVVIEQSIQQHYPAISDREKKFVTAFSLGAWGLVDQLLASDDLEDRVTTYDAIVSRVKTPTLIYEQMQRLHRVAEHGQIDQLLDALLYMNIGSADLHIRTKKRLATNMGQDNVLFGWCVDLLEAA